MIMGTVAVASAKDYADIKADSDYAEAIDVLSNLNILDGFKTGETYNFQPDGYFTPCSGSQDRGDRPQCGYQRQDQEAGCYLQPVQQRTEPVR